MNWRVINLSSQLKKHHMNWKYYSNLTYNEFQKRSNFQYNEQMFTYGLRGNIPTGTENLYSPIFKNFLKVAEYMV